MNQKTQISTFILVEKNATFSSACSQRQGTSKVQAWRIFYSSRRSDRTHTQIVCDRGYNRWRDQVAICPPLSLAKSHANAHLCRPETVRPSQDWRLHLRRGDNARYLFSTVSKLLLRTTLAVFATWHQVVCVCFVVELEYLSTPSSISLWRNSVCWAGRGYISWSVRKKRTVGSMQKRVDDGKR